MASPSVAPSTITPAPAAGFSNQQRWIELLVVLFVAIAAPLTASMYTLFFGYSGNGVAGNLRYFYLLVQQVGAVLVLWYVLRRTGRTFSDIGFRPSIKGAFIGLALAALGWLAYVVVLTVTQVIHKHYFGTYIVRANSALLFPKASWAVLLPFLLFNGFYEEAIVRAYLMTELSQLTASIGLAAAASIILQASYHTYQGWLAVSGLTATFAVFSIYYARSRRLFPIYIAHVVVDLFAVMSVMTK